MSTSQGGSPIGIFTYSNPFGLTFTVLSVVYWLGIIYYALNPVIMTRGQFAILFVGYSMVLYITWELQGLETNDEYSIAEVTALLLMILAAIIITVYMAYHHHDLRIGRAGTSYWYEYIMATVLIAVLAYLIFREYGYTFVSVLFFAFFYAYFGNLFPSWLYHAGLSETRILHTTVLEISGVYGSIVVTVGTWIAPFLLFSGLVQAFGAFNLIVRGALVLTNYMKSGIAQTAVVGSLLIGSINGAAVANAGISGSVTIPVMKENGIRGRTAAAIESVASSGGQIMPPIMGAAAFLMANLLQIPYADILTAAFIPALIFYIIVGVNVHVIASREISDRAALDMEEHFDFEERTTKSLLLEAMQFLIPLAVLLYLLVVIRYSIMYSAIITAGMTVFTTMVYTISRDPSVNGVKQFLLGTVDGCREGAKVTAPIGLIVAAISAIIALFMATGVPNMLAFALMDLSGGTFIGVVVMAFIICVILGLGMPTVGAYLLVALIVAPSIIRNFGHPELAVHFFVFFAAILSALTPPIAVAVVVASGIANSKFWPTCFDAMRIGFPLFVLPFVFMYHPEILDTGFTVERMSATATIFVGMLGLTVAFNSQIPEKISRSVNVAADSYRSVALDYAVRVVFTLVGIGILFLQSMTLRFLLIAVLVLLVLGTQQIHKRVATTPTN